MTENQQRAASAEKGQTHPSGDERFKMLDVSMKRQRFQPDALIADFRRGKFVNHLTNVSLENSRFVPSHR